MALFHTALEARLADRRYVIEMTPAWNLRDPTRGVVLEGPVGTRWLDHSRAFRYEVRCWPNGILPDRETAVGSPVRIPASQDAVATLLALVPGFPTATWGRDDKRTGDM